MLFYHLVLAVSCSIWLSDAVKRRHPSTSASRSPTSQLPSSGSEYVNACTDSEMEHGPSWLISVPDESSQIRATKRLRTLQRIERVSGETCSGLAELERARDHQRQAAKRILGLEKQFTARTREIEQWISQSEQRIQYRAKVWESQRAQVLDDLHRIGFEEQEKITTLSMEEMTKCEKFNREYESERTKLGNWMSHVEDLPEETKEHYSEIHDLAKNFMYFLQVDEQRLIEEKKEELITHIVTTVASRKNEDEFRKLESEMKSIADSASDLLREYIGKRNAFTRQSNVEYELGVGISREIETLYSDLHQCNGGASLNLQNLKTKVQEHRTALREFDKLENFLLHRFDMSQLKKLRKSYAALEAKVVNYQSHFELCIFDNQLRYSIMTDLNPQLSWNIFSKLLPFYQQSLADMKAIIKQFVECDDAQTAFLLLGLAQRNIGNNPDTPP